MNPKKPEHKRTRLYIDPPVQGALVRRLIMHWAAACTLVVVYLLTIDLMNAMLHGSGLEWASALRKYGTLGVFLLVLTPIFIFDTIKLSNRFVGPMKSLRRSLNALARGQRIPMLSFRKGDFWQECTGDFNRVVSELNRLREQTESQSDSHAEQLETQEVQ